MGYQDNKPKLEWIPIVEFKRFSQGNQDVKKAPKVVQLMTVSDGSFGLSMSDDKGRIVIKLSRAEALELAYGVLNKVKFNGI